MLGIYRNELPLLFVFRRFGCVEAQQLQVNGDQQATVDPNGYLRYV
jgi:hypothetical protein